MDLDTKVIGQVLQDVPLGHLVGNLGLGIADAQGRLDTMAIAAALRLAEEKTTMLDADGNKVTRSLLELGFAPTFYQFTEATLEVSFIVNMKVFEATTIGFDFNIAGQIGNVPDEQEGIADDISDAEDDDNFEDEDEDEDDDDDEVETV